MAVTQDTFTQYAGLGFHGQQNTDYPAWIGSYHAESAIGFGVAVSFGTGEGQARAGGASSGVLIGVTLRTQAVENNASGNPEYAKDQAMSVMEKGRMYVTVASGCTRGQPVYVVPGTGVLTNASTDNVALTGARFLRTAAAGEVTEIELK